MRIFNTLYVLHKIFHPRCKSSAHFRFLTNVATNLMQPTLDSIIMHICYRSSSSSDSDVDIPAITMRTLPRPTVPANQLTVPSTSSYHNVAPPRLVRGMRYIYDVSWLLSMFLNTDKDMEEKYFNIFVERTQIHKTNLNNVTQCCNLLQQWGKLMNLIACRLDFSILLNCNEERLNKQSVMVLIF